MITVDRKQFSQAVQFASTVLSRRNTIPVLTGIKAVANGSLSFEATDLDNFARVELPYDGDHYSFCLSEPRGLRSAVDNAGGKEVSFEPGEKGHLKVSCGALDSDLHAFPADDHPGAERVVEELFGCDIGSAELRQIARVTAAISTEETRYYLNGIAVFKVGDWLYRFVATDGHRLMWVDIPMPAATGEIADGTIIPRAFINIALAHFSRAKEATRLSYGHHQRRNRPGETLTVEKSKMPRVELSADFGGVSFTLSGKLIDGTYPDYTRVIPQENPHVARMKRANLIQAVNTLTPLTTCKRRAVKLTLDKDGATIALKSPDIGASNFKLPVEHSFSEPFIIGFNGQYLLDICNAFTGDELEMHLSDPGAPVLFVDPSDTAFGAVQMPMRV